MLHNVYSSVLLELVRSRFLYPNETALFAHSPLERKYQFDLVHLQEDICRVYLVGKPDIRNPEELRSQFKFTVPKIEALELGISTEDLDILDIYLEDELKVRFVDMQEYFYASQLNDMFICIQLLLCEEFCSLRDVRLTCLDPVAKWLLSGL